MQSFSLGFLLVGGALIGLHAVSRQLFNVDDRNNDEADIPLRRDSSPEPAREADVLNPRGQRIVFCSTALAICARVEVFRQTLGYRQCTVPGLEVRLSCSDQGLHSDDCLLLGIPTIALSCSRIHISECEAT